MNKTIICAFVCTLLVGCATSTPIMGPSGPAHIVKCGSAVIEACYRKASELCPSGYTVGDQQQSGNGMVNQVGSSLMFVRGPSTMLVQCK